MKNDDDCGCIFPIVIIALILAALIGGGHLGYESHKDESVKAGHAEYYLDKDNNRQWRWLAPCGEKENANANH